MRLLLLLFLATMAVSTTRMNAVSSSPYVFKCVVQCGSDVSEYKNYLNSTVNVPLEQVADMVVGTPKSLAPPYEDLFDRNGRYTSKHMIQTPF